MTVLQKQLAFIFVLSFINHLEMEKYLKILLFLTKNLVEEVIYFCLTCSTKIYLGKKICKSLSDSFFDELKKMLVQYFFLSLIATACFVVRYFSFVQQPIFGNFLICSDYFFVYSIVVNNGD